MSFNPHDDQYDGFTFPKPGAHIVRVTKADCCLSKEKRDKAGNVLPRKNMIEFALEVVGDDPDKGATIPFIYFVIQDNVLWRLAQLCRALHPAVQEFDPKDQREVTREFMGRHCVITAEEVESEYKGKTSMKIEVKEYMYPQAPVIKQLDAMRDPNEAAASGPSMGAPAASSVANDDIPF